MDSMKYELEGHLNLVLECFYNYEPEVPEDDINPREEASVTLERVYLGEAPLELYSHLTPEQWMDIEQYILECTACDL